MNILRRLFWGRRRERQDNMDLYILLTQENDANLNGFTVVDGHRIPIDPSKPRMCDYAKKSHAYLQKYTIR